MMSFTVSATFILRFFLNNDVGNDLLETQDNIF